VTDALAAVDEHAAAQGGPVDLTAAAAPPPEPAGTGPGDFTID
jgi:hypothetical protein